MTVDFFSLLNETNSIKNEETGEITLTIPEFETDNTITIESECKLTSNCNTVIRSTNFGIISQSAFINNITFETPIIITDSFNVNIKNCCIKNKNVDNAIIINNSKSIFFDQITIKDINASENVITILNNSHLIASHLLIDTSTEFMISCKNESKLYLSDSQLIHSKSNGFFVSENSYLEMESCKISETVHPSIYIEKSTGKINKSEINNTQMNGIVLNNVSSFEIASNKITNINGSAISIINDSFCNIHHNIISKINNNGIYVDNSHVNIYKNELSDIRCPGIATLKKSKANISENMIYDIKSCGIRVLNSKKMEINKNEIKNIGECAISILNTKKCSVNNNEISNCKVSAVESYNSSVVNIFSNHIFDIKEYAFLAYTSGKINAENNSIQNIGKSMVNLIYNGGGNFINNKIENCPSQKEGQTSSQYFFNQNGNFTGITNDETRTTSSIHFEESNVENTGMCINCNKKPRKCYLLNCGHKLYCQDCAKEAHQSHKKCPLCRLPIIDLNEGFKTNDEICQICLDHKADCIIIPCGHIGYCHKCLNKWFKNEYRCPYCQIEPVTFRNIQDI